jgi:gamma-glutamyl-gamma-aminobutyrate hydrolase PuuD
MGEKSRKKKIIIIDDTKKKQAKQKKPSIKKLIKKPKTEKKIKLKAPKKKQAVTAPIVITYREDGKTAGKAAFFDHVTFRNATGVKTAIAAPKELPATQFYSYLNYREGHNYYGLPGNLGRPQAVNSKTIADCGLIVIPGEARVTATANPDAARARKKHELELIRQARLRGQPVLAICAGSWRLWQAYGGKTKAVSDHNYGGAMPRLSTTGAKVVNNKQIHRINLTVNSMLAKAMYRKKAIGQPTVNSVHWLAADSSSTPKMLEVVATTKQDNAIAANNRQGSLMKPTKGSVEAFETKFGAPMIGVQWHPEAYNPKDPASLAPTQHIQLLQFMMEAGRAYQRRREVVKELNARFNLVANNEVSLFGVAAVKKEKPALIKRATYSS